MWYDKDIGKRNLEQNKAERVGANVKKNTLSSLEFNEFKINLHKNKFCSGHSVYHQLK